MCDSDQDDGDARSVYTLLLTSVRTSEEGSLEIENRSIDGQSGSELGSGSGIIQIYETTKLPNVGGDSCGKIARAEDSQHGTVGIESDVFLYGSLRTAKEEPLDCNDVESTLSNGIKETVLVRFFILFLTV